MKIECPHCAYSKEVDSTIFPQNRDVNLSCPQCKSKFMINTQQEQAAEVVAPNDDLSIFDEKPEPELFEQELAAEQKVEPVTQNAAPPEYLAPPQTKKSESTVAQPVRVQRSDKPMHLLIVNFLELLLIKARGYWNQNFFDKNAIWVEKIGHYCVLVSAVLGLIIGLLLAIKSDQLTPLGLGFGWMFAVLVLQYIAHKFIVAGASLIDSTQSQMSSTSFLDSMSVLNVILGVAFLVGGVISAIKFSDWTHVMAGLMLCWAFEYFASLSMHPQLLNIKIVEKATAGQEAVGLISFFMKGMLKLVPVYFGTWMILATLQLVDALFSLFNENMEPFFTSTTAAIYFVFAALLLPFAIYLIFMFYYLVIDVIHAILIVPGKLDLISKAGAADEQ